MDTVHKQEYRIRDLPTRSVTLFPTRAQVVRDIKDVPLQPGANQITVVGLTPTVDEHSIKVEGTGSAIISDIAVELLPNREIFQDIYPESDSDDSEEEEEEEEDDYDASKDSEEMKEVRKKLTELRDDQKRAKEIVASAESRLKILDAYGKMLDRKRSIDIDAGIETYRAEREKVFQDHMSGTVRDRELGLEIFELTKEESRLSRLKLRTQQKELKAKAKAQRLKSKEKEKERRRLAEKTKERTRVRKERENFWPKQCYTVRITLEATSFTPSSSRRASIASAAELVKGAPEKEAVASPGLSEDGGSPATCDLSLSYVTSSAFWSPTYDFQLSTTSNTAMLCFDAKLTNATSETWNNCKVILSTSQTTFSGLNDSIPILMPWRVKLAKGRGHDDILHSNEEITHKGGWQAQQQSWPSQKPRAQLFGIEPASSITGTDKAIASCFAAAQLHQQQQQQQQQQLQQRMRTHNIQQWQAPAPQQAVTTSLFGAGPSGGGGSATGGLFGSAAPPPPPAMAAAPVVIGAARSLAVEKKSKKKSASPGGANVDFYGTAIRAEHEAEEQDASEDGDDRTVMPEPTPELEFQESSFEETGMTTTYDLPGLKTLAPSSAASKQRVARISFTGVVFSHTIVAKYKPAAFLKAKLRNASKITLLKGPAGLTLDGSFMGRATLPRCSAGDSFTMSLGVDPAIRVAYPKPDVRRATTGLFSKEDSSVYRRSVTVANTRANAGSKPVNLLVLDQVPVSEDEKLRIDIQQPRGLSVGGAAVPAGAGASPKDEKDWGRATATLKKAGEVAWDVQLNAGRSVRLALEYEVAVPAGEGVVQVYA